MNSSHASCRNVEIPLPLLGFASGKNQQSRKKPVSDKTTHQDFETQVVYPFADRGRKIVRGTLAVACMVVVALVAWAQTEHYPLISHADVPLYPPLARALNLTGTVEIQLVIAKGIVTDAQVKSVVINCRNCAPLTDEGEKKVGKYLSLPSIANIQSWRFDSEENATFVVRYVYRIEGAETERAENPDVEVNLPLISVTAKPIKPTVSY